MDSQLKVEINLGADVPVASVNGASFPVADYAVTYEDGRVLVSLVVAADAVSVGRSPASIPAPGIPTARWGDPGVPDPREDIPGWQPDSSGEWIAGHAESRAAGLEHIRRLGLGRPIKPLGLDDDGGSAAVTA